MKRNLFWSLFVLIALLVLSAVAIYANSDQPLFLKSHTIINPTLSQAAAYGNVKYGDIDSDGDIDIVTAGASIEIWVNDGEFNFSASQVFTETGTTFDVQIADLNGDNNVDIFVAANIGMQLPNAPDRVLINDGGGMFTFTTQQLGNSASYTPVLADIDGDNDLDAIVPACFWSISTAFANQDKVWLNNGNGSFTDSGLELDEACTVELAVGDFNGDDRLDILRYRVAGIDVNQAEILLNENEAELVFTQKSLFTLNDPQFTISDLNNDGYDDLLLLSDENTDAVPNGNNVWLNDGQGNLNNTNQALGTTVSGYLTAIDYDKDGDKDMITTDVDKITHHIWMNMDNGVFLHVDQFVADPHIDLDLRASIAVDVTADLWEDLLIATDSGIEIWENQQQAQVETVHLFLPFVNR